jgi:hypothetical protein
MENQKHGLFLLLSASLVAIAGCATPGGESGDAVREDTVDTEDVAEGAQAACAAGVLDCGTWGPWEAIPVIADACDVPATAYHGDYLFAAYSACGTNQIYVTSYYAGSWAKPYAVSGALSVYSPSLAVLDGNLYMGYTGLDRGVFVRRYSGLRWTDIGGIGVTSTYAPTLVGYGGRLHAVYGGVDDEISATAWDGRYWSKGTGWGVRSKVRPGIAAFDNRLYATYPGVRGRMGLGYWDGSAFTARGSIPDVYTSYPLTLAPHAGYLNFFVPRGRQGGIGWMAYDGKAWAGSVVIPTELVGSVPPAVGYYDKHAALFALGAGGKVHWARSKGWP